MCLVCPSVATHLTCQFWARSEPVNMPKTIVSRQMWSACYNSIPLFRKFDEDVVLLHLIVRPHTAAATKRLLKRSRWEVIDHPPSSACTWLPVIFISFRVWNCRRRTRVWYNEVQTSVENWLKAQAAGCYDKVAAMTRVFESWYTQVRKWLPAVNKHKFTHPQVTSRGSDRRGNGRGRVCSLMSIICGGSAEYYVNQKARYTDLPNISSTVCISRTTQPGSELSADLTCMKLEVGWTLFCLFREAIYESACTPWRARCVAAAVCGCALSCWKNIPLSCRRKGK